MMKFNLFPLTNSHNILKQVLNLVCPITIVQQLIQLLRAETFKNIYSNVVPPLSKPHHTMAKTSSNRAPLHGSGIAAAKKAAQRLHTKEQEASAAAGEHNDNGQEASHGVEDYY